MAGAYPKNEPSKTTWEAIKCRIEESRVFLLPAQYIGEQGKKDEIDGRDMACVE
jgi:hypothetical protein